MVFHMVKEDVIVRVAAFCKCMEEEREEKLSELLTTFAKQNNLICVEGHAYQEENCLVMTDSLDDIVLGMKAGDYDLLVVEDFSDISASMCMLASFVQQALWNGCEVYSVKHHSFGRIHCESLL